jgi:hypothetical protein
MFRYSMYINGILCIHTVFGEGRDGLDTEITPGCMLGIGEHQLMVCTGTKPCARKDYFFFLL